MPDDPAMKAAVFKALGEPLVIEERPEPIPNRTDVLVKVGRCGICGSDLHMTEDAFFRVPANTVLGHEYCGEVYAVGEDVQSIKVGDRIAVFPVRSCGHCVSCMEGNPVWCARMQLEGGGYAQYSLADERQCIRLPNTFSLEDGALIEPLAVGLHGVQMADLRPGARVLVLGAGPIGLATAFWARRFGAQRVVVTASSRRRESLALELGATRFLSSEAASVDAVSKACNGLPDIVFECVGKPGLIAAAIEHVRPRGNVVVLGLCTVLDSFVPFTAIAKEARIQASAFYRPRDFEIAADLFDAGVVEPRSMITDRISLAELPAAFEALRHRSHQCKVMVDPWAIV
jgi:(R,R)-butanediol dehydrogenase/meso-butanediol dehydrogenase/diacetyl reductase